MLITRITPNLQVRDLESAEPFYRDFLGLREEEFDLRWVSRLTAPDTGVSVQLVTHDATSAADSAISAHTDDVESAYAAALDAGFEIVHPLTTEAWGVHRFLVRAPDGTVVNVVQHRD